MKSICFLRHGATAGNLEKRYIGKTDEPLCEIGVLQAKAADIRALPPFDAVFASPLVRCAQTAGLIFAGQALEIRDGLRECDFGIFEGRTAEELSDSSEYAAWLATLCEGQIPGGEDVLAFKERCCRAFEEIVAALPEGKSAAIVTHGGCIMSVLERYARPKRSFYEYHIGNCEWALCEYEAGVLRIVGASQQGYGRK